MKKLMIILVSVMFMSTAAFAATTPEFDAVGDDSGNYFNGAIENSVVAHNEDGFGDLINADSDFTDHFIASGLWGESFSPTIGLYPDPCFPEYLSVFTARRNCGSYEWRIVLQMKPQTDLDLNIVDCVLDGSGNSIWANAGQTGRYVKANGVKVFVKGANPRITVEAFAGPCASFAGSFYMDARKMPSLNVGPLVETLYTSKALWEEGLVMVLPKTGKTNRSNQDTYDLHQGDMLKVNVEVPTNNTADIRYGQDNVVVKYVGLIGSELTAGMVQIPE